MRLASVIAVSLSLAACPASPPPAATTATDDASVALPSAGEPDPIARVEGVPVDRRRFERELAQSLARYELARKAVEPDMVDRLKASLVRRHVEAEVIRQKAVELQIAPTPEELGSAWDEYRRRFGSREGLIAFLERSGTTEEDLQARFVDSLLLDRVSQHLAQSADVDEDELKAAYEKELPGLRRPEQRRVAQLLVSVPKGATDEVRRDRRKRAEEARNRLRRGAPFEELVERFSDGPAKSRGGDLGFVSRERLLPPVAEAAFRLRPGQSSDVISTRFGFVLISVVDQRPSHTPSLEEVRPALTTELLGRKRRRVVHEALDSWKRSMNIELLEPTQLFTNLPSATDEAPTAPQ